eukprot:1052769-Rhodomonas_salina.3
MRCARQGCLFPGCSAQARVSHVSMVHEASVGHQRAARFEAATRCTASGAETRALRNRCRRVPTCLPSRRPQVPFSFSLSLSLSLSLARSLARSRSCLAVEWVRVLALLAVE